MKKLVQKYQQNKVFKLLVLSVFVVLVIATISARLGRNGFESAVLVQDSVGINDSVKVRIGSVNPEDVVAKVKDAYGREIQVSAQTIEENGETELTVTPPSGIKPGKYVLELSDQQEKVSTKSLEFRWGVLAVNTDKSIYDPESDVEIYLGSLDDEGHTLCDSNLELEITNPDGKKKIFNTDNPEGDEIIRGEDCGYDNVTDLPDYYVDYFAPEEGEYQLKLTNLDTEYSTADSFEVSGDTPFIISRQGATRINPFKAAYGMNITITSKVNFDGEFIEEIPDDFIILDSDVGFLRRKKGSRTQLVWPLKIAEGETKEFSYYYRTPLVSPWLYTIGPNFVARRDGDVRFTESRKWQLASDASGDGVALLGGTQTTSSTNINDTPAAPIIWATAGYDSLHYAHNAGTNPERVTIAQAGDYLVSATVPMTGTVARSAVRTEILVNGVAVDGAIGESSYIRNSDDHTESSDTVTLLLQNLSINDYIEVYTEATAGTGTITVDGQASLFLEHVEPTRTVFSGTATQTTNSTNLNQATAYPMQWTEGRKDTGYTHSDATSSENITLDTAGDYMVFVNIPIEGAVSRGNVKLLVQLDGATVPGGEGKQGYLRSSAGHANSSIHWAGMVRASAANQVLTIAAQQEGNAGTITTTVGKTASIMVDKMSTTDFYFGRSNALVGGNNWNPSTPAELTWTTDEIIDTSTYSHSTTVAPESIVVNKSGDYILTYNDSLTSAVARANPKITVRVNGTDIPGISTSSHYIRITSDHTESSGAIVVLLEDLVAGDAITVAAQQEAAAGQVDDDQDALITLRYVPVSSSPLITQMHYHWRNDDGSEAGATSAVSGTEDTPFVNLAKDSILRLRMEVSNEGGAASTGEAYRLEFGKKDTTCALVSTWTDVGAASDEWDMYDSANLTDGSDTTNISLVSGGVTDEATTFKTPNAAVKDTASETASLILAQNEFVELEYSIRSTALAEAGATYCFRLTDAGTILDAYSAYPEISITPDTPVVGDNDFKIQRGEMMVTGTGVTLVAGADYDQPISASRAFIRISNTQHTGAGDDGSGGNQNADDVTAYIQDPENIMTSVTITRPSSFSNSHVSWEIVEYIGPIGGANEIVVRDQGTTTYGTADLTKSTSTITGIVDDNDVVPFITGHGNPDTGRNDFNTSLSTAAWNAANDQIDFTRGETGDDAVITSWAAVEFVGTNWNIQRSEHTYSVAGSIQTQAITAVNDLSKAFLHTQKRVNGLAGLDEYGHEIWISAVDEISYQLESGAGTPANHVSVAWVIENTQTNGTPMIVTRSDGTQAAGAEPSTVLVNIGKTLADITTASIFTNNRVTGTGTAFPRAMMGVMIDSETQYRLWISDTGQTRTYRTEVVEWPSAVHAGFVQSAYRWFVQDDSTDVGAALEAQDTGIILGQAGEQFRLRMLLTVTGSELAVNGRQFKLQYALSGNGGCDTAFSGESYEDITTTTDLAYYDNSTPADADSVTANANDPDIGNTVVAQEYVELNNFSNSIALITSGNDGLWDFSLYDNGLDAGKYCLRAVDSDGNILTTYDVIPEFDVTFSTDILMRHGSFFDAVGIEKPFTF